MPRLRVLLRAPSFRTLSGRRLQGLRGADILSSRNFALFPAYCPFSVSTQANRLFKTVSNVKFKLDGMLYCRPLPSSPIASLICPS
jgi:hypothetical protein